MCVWSFSSNIVNYFQLFNKKKVTVETVLALTPTPTSTISVIPTPTVSVTPTCTPTVTPTLTLSQNLSADIINIASQQTAIKNKKLVFDDGVIYWSDKVWSLPEEKISQPENFIKIVDNTPTSTNKKDRLAYFKKID